MKTQYVAIDGTVFDTECECEKYEEIMNDKYMEYIVAYDVSGYRVEFPDANIETMQDWANEIEFIYIKKQIPDDMLKNIRCILPYFPCWTGWYRKEENDEFTSLASELRNICEKWWACPFNDDLETVLLQAIDEI